MMLPVSSSSSLSNPNCASSSASSFRTRRRDRLFVQRSPPFVRAFGPLEHLIVFTFAACERLGRRLRRRLRRQLRRRLRRRRGGVRQSIPFVDAFGSGDIAFTLTTRDRRSWDISHADNSKWLGGACGIGGAGAFHPPKDGDCCCVDQSTPVRSGGGT
eukprot:6195724-Pleurochrysis_carterae.AAC.2